MSEIAPGWTIQVGHTEDGAVYLEILDNADNVQARALMNPIVSAQLIDQLFVSTEAAARAVTAPQGSC